MIFTPQNAIHGERERKKKKELFITSVLRENYETIAQHPFALYMLIERHFMIELLFCFGN